MNNDGHRLNIGCMILDIIHEIHARTKAAVIKSTSNSIVVRCNTLEDSLKVDNIVDEHRANYSEEIETIYKTDYDYTRTYRFRYIGKHEEGYSHLFDTDIASMYPDIRIRRRRMADIDCIKKVIFSGPCTIILWCDGTKTIVKCGPDDEFDKEKGIAMCILKKMFGSSHQMSKWMKEQIGEEEEEEQGFKLPPFFYADDKKIDLGGLDDETD